MKIPLQSRKRGSINERLHLFAKDEKGYPFVGSRACAANHYAIAENFPYVQSSSGVDFAESRVR